jgi:hypothetical protein
VSKEYLIMRDIICAYHPSFFKNKKLRKFGLEQPGLFKVEKLVEQSMASLGSYDYIDAAHADFSDGSDSKTASISINPKVIGQKSYRGYISSVSNVGGNQKAGALRCVIYNPHKQDLRYYFLPKNFWIDHVIIDCGSGEGRIEYLYNIDKDTINKFKGYECVDFEELAFAE